MVRERDLDQLVGAFRAYVQALTAHNQGQIAVGESVVTAQQNLCDALKRALGTKIEESAQ